MNPSPNEMNPLNTAIGRCSFGTDRPLQARPLPQRREAYARRRLRVTVRGRLRGCLIAAVTAMMFLPSAANGLPQSLTVGELASDPCIALAGDPWTTQPIPFNSLSPADGSSVTGVSKHTPPNFNHGTAITFTLQPTHLVDPDSVFPVLDVWNATGALVDEQRLSTGDGGHTYSVTTDTDFSPWTQAQGTYYWEVVNSYGGEWTDSTGASVTGCVVQYTQARAINIVPPAITRAAATSYTRSLIGPGAAGRLSCSPAGNSWTARCALKWTRGVSSYAANGTFENYIGPASADFTSGGADPWAVGGGIFWRYDFAGTRRWRSCSRSRCRAHQQRFRWQGHRGPTQGPWAKS